MQLYTPLRLTVAINVQAGEKCSRRPALPCRQWLLKYQFRDLVYIRRFDGEIILPYCSCFMCHTICTIQHISI